MVQILALRLRVRSTSPTACYIAWLFSSPALERPDTPCDSKHQRARPSKFSLADLKTLLPLSASHLTRRSADISNASWPYTLIAAPQQGRQTRPACPRAYTTFATSTTALSMIYLPPLRRLLLPSLLFLACILYFKSTSKLPTTRQQLANLITRQPELSPQGERVPADQAGNGYQVATQDVARNYKSPMRNLYYPYFQNIILDNLGGLKEIKHPKPEEHLLIQKLSQCPIKANPVTDHVRLPNRLYNISLIAKNETENERKGALNPAIISLPHWSENQYLLVHRVATDGSHQQNLLCEANICYTNEKDARAGEKPCNETDIEVFNGMPGFRCATPPMTLNVPSTPAENCGKGTGVLMDVPGFHDPRIFWSGKGEPLMMVNSQSRYACFGLWMIDLRKLDFSLDTLLASNPFKPSLGPLMSYPSLTEITRNPRNTRSQIEKNWMIFGSDKGDHYVHYDISPTKRTFAKLLGGGITTVNLTDPYEFPCLEADNKPSPDGTEGTWHQGTNSLMLILCDRFDSSCKPNAQNSVFFSVIHHKHKNAFSLPLRYERYVVAWSAVPPFSMLGISQHPLLMANETANNFSPEENWEDDPEQKSLLAAGKKGKGNWAYFTYTVSIAWAWGRAMDEPQDKNMGYLDDEVILGIGVDDKAMVYTRILAKDLLQCLRACPGRAQDPITSEGEFAAGNSEVPGFRMKEYEEKKAKAKNDDDEEEDGEKSSPTAKVQTISPDEQVAMASAHAEEIQSAKDEGRAGDIGRTHAGAGMGLGGGGGYSGSEAEHLGEEVEIVEEPIVEIIEEVDGVV